MSNTVMREFLDALRGEVFKALCVSDDVVTDYLDPVAACIKSNDNKTAFEMVQIDARRASAKAHIVHDLLNDLDSLIVDFMKDMTEGG